jgi:hypothetical protein
MFTDLKIALSMTLVVATVSSALAGPKQPAHHQRTVQPQILAGAHLSLGPLHGFDALHRSV